jgi:hypothetical protein
VTNPTNRALDELARLDKASGGTGTDYKLAQLLDVPRATISNYRRGVTQLDDVLAIRLAELIKEQPLRLIGEINAERARDTRTKAFWSKTAKGAGGKVAALVGAVIMAAVAFSPPPARAESLSPNSPANHDREAGQFVDLYNAHISRRRRRRWDWWRRFMTWLPIPQDLSGLTGARPGIATLA